MFGEDLDSTKKSGSFSEHELDSNDTGAPLDAKSAGLSFVVTYLQLLESLCSLFGWMRLAINAWNFQASLFT